MRCPRSLSSSYRILGWPKIKPSPEGFIFWHIVNFTDDMPREKTICQFEKAFDTWQEAFDRIDPKGRAIEFRSTSSYDDAHIKLYFVNPGLRFQHILCEDGKRRKINIPVPMDGQGKVLAYVPYGEHNIYFDEGEKWSDLTDARSGGICLMDVTLHEMGHTLDLAHSEITKAVMGAYYDGTPKTITDDDLSGASEVWSKVKMKYMTKAMSIAAQLSPSHKVIIEMLKFYGMKEIHGPESNNKLIKIMREYIGWAEDDSNVAWCSILLDHVCKNNGIERPESAAAVDWKNMGESVDLTDISIGDVVVFFRTTESNWQGHVGVFISTSENDNYIWVLGGNQSNQVNIQMQKISKIRKDGIRRLRYITNDK